MGFCIMRLIMWVECGQAEEDYVTLSGFLKYQFLHASEQMISGQPQQVGCMNCMWTVLRPLHSYFKSIACRLEVVPLCTFCGMALQHTATAAVF
jgi:hypothetical protein